MDTLYILCLFILSFITHLDTWYVQFYGLCLFELLFSNTVSLQVVFFYILFFSLCCRASVSWNSVLVLYLKLICFSWYGQDKIYIWKWKQRHKNHGIKKPNTSAHENAGLRKRRKVKEGTRMSHKGIAW